MWIINAVISGFFDVILWPFARMTPWIGLIVVSAITGIIMLAIFKFTSKQDKIKRQKDYIKGYMLQMRLFKDDLSLLGAAQSNILKHNLHYLKYAVVPLLFILVPVILIMIQLNLRYGPEPLEVGDTVVVKAYFDGAIPEGVVLEPGDGYKVETPPVHIKREGEVAWRVKTTKPGDHELVISSPTGEVGKSLVVAPRKTVRVSERRVRTFWDHISWPGEKPIPGTTEVNEIVVNYPASEMELLSISIHWIITFFVVSVAAGFALKGVFGVEI
ncbi:MAG: hypothetical protein GY771_05450 [bacterium]|nr:hypothetical protein [bacterium]